MAPLSDIGLVPRLWCATPRPEEGLNLHGRGTLLVHYDLPWSPNRVEQRLGRLDRFGVATPVTSAVPVARGDALAARAPTT